MGISVSDVLQNDMYESQLEGITQTTQNQSDTEVKSMTYNLRIQEADQKDKNSPYYWENRKQAILDMISGKASNNGQPLDFVALQECGTTYSYHTWEQTINEELKPGGALEGYGAVEVGSGDNIILYRKDKWQLGKTQVFDVGTNQVIGAQFTRIGHPDEKPMNIFGGHLPHAGAAPKSLQGLANDICGFEGADGGQKHWADDHRTLFMMDSNDKEKIDGDPSYDHDEAFQWAGLYDLFYETRPGDKGGFTNHAWDFEGTPDLREDLQFESGYDKDAANSSEVVQYKYNYNGQMYNPSDHLAVLNTTYFKNDEPPPFNPHTPTSIQDLKTELTQFGDLSSDHNVKALVAATLPKVDALASQGLSLNSIESWAYAAIIGKMTSDSTFSIGFGNISAADQATFKTIAGIDQFEGVLSTHGFNLSQITTMAKNFADGAISLANPQDKLFMETFYADLQAGQSPAVAAQNAYSTVPYSSLSEGMQTFISELTDTYSTKNDSSHTSEENPFGNSSYNFQCELF